MVSVPVNVRCKVFSLFVTPTMVDELPGDNCLVKLALSWVARTPLESSRAPPKGDESIVAVRPSEKKASKKKSITLSKTIFRRFAAIQFQSSKASETNGPILERQRNYNLSVTRSFLSHLSSSSSSFLRLFATETLEKDSHCRFAPAQQGQGTCYVVQGCSGERRILRERVEGATFLHRLIRKEWKDSIPSSFSPLFGPSSPVEGANSCIWAWQIAARDPLMMRTNEPRVARGEEKD